MNKQAFLTHLSLEVHVLDLWLEQEWLVPARREAELHFSEADVARARLIRDLQGGFGVNDPGVDVILHLLDQLHGFRRAFEDLHEGMGGQSRG